MPAPHLAIIPPKRPLSPKRAPPPLRRRGGASSFTHLIHGLSPRSASVLYLPSKPRRTFTCVLYTGRDAKQDLIALQVTLEERTVGHLCEEIVNICEHPIEASERGYI
jgi:hypothetical protein